MVILSEVQSSNARIASTLPAGLVAVFVGGTSGIGETALKQFVKHARQPRIYYIGRSQEAADRIATACKHLNPDGEYNLIKADTSLIRNVDPVCQEIRSKEKAVNVLCLTTGTLLSHTETSENLHFATSLAYYSRTRFIVNLLPLLKQASSLRRVVTVFAAGYEGPITTSDFQAWKVPMLSQRGHVSSLITVSLEALARDAPSVSFIHNFPGSVKTNLARGGEGAAIYVLKQVFKLIGPMINMPNEECGERQLFLATSGKYPSEDLEASGVPLTAGDSPVANGTSGKSGSGVYSVGSDGESSGARVVKLLAQFRKEGMVEQVWKHTDEEFERITGSDPA
ncbi:MAG: hypothetical protein LQ350_002214 [Teloschistes chrysophthalmus]|nr:MAG: hypothetical protein LQ350_002214 [Niorma chrysophthalma]